MLTDRDRARLAGVHPVLAAALVDVFTQLEHEGTPMFVVSGVRTATQQAALYAQGRTAPGPVVTEKDGIAHKSDHQVESDGFGHAVDCAFVPRKDRSDCFAPAWPWARFGALLEQHTGCQWGGRWKKPADLDHAQYTAPLATKG